MRLLSAIVVFVVLAIPGRGQVTIAPTVNENAAFDTLAARYDRNELRVDTAWAVNDSLWVALLMIGDSDSTLFDGGWMQTGGVCAFYFLMTMDPRSGAIKDYREIYSACDADQSDHDAVYDDHRILTSSTVEVISSQAHYMDDSDDWDKLVPFETRLFKVLQTGMIADMGSGLITEPGLWKDR